MQEKAEVMEWIELEDMPRAQRRFAKEMEYANRKRIKKLFDINIGV